MCIKLTDISAHMELSIIIPVSYTFPSAHGYDEIHMCYQFTSGDFPYEVDQYPHVEQQLWKEEEKITYNSFVIC